MSSEKSKVKIITFPWIFPGSALDGKKYYASDINGGMKRIADFGLSKNTFFGGRVETFGLLKEFGFFLCKDWLSGETIGFYVHSAGDVTSLGKEVLRRNYPLLVMPFDEDPPMTEREADVAAWGYAPEVIQRENAKELESLIKTFVKEKDDAQMVETPAEEPNDVSKMSIDEFKADIRDQANEILRSAKAKKPKRTPTDVDA